MVVLILSLVLGLEESRILTFWLLLGTTGKLLS